MRVLLIGSGGREHAIATRLARSRRFGRLWTVPGNAGTGRLGENVALDIGSVGHIRELAHRIQADLVVLGPDEAGASGVADLLRADGVATFGPGRQGAQIEWSKAFARDLLQRAGLRVAAGGHFQTYEAAAAYVRDQGRPVVVKADGLAAGKGVFVCDTEQEALQAIETLLMDKALGASGASIVVEERLYGVELSTHAFTDGETIVHMPFSSDYKRLLDGDLGPNTGGIGVCSPSNWTEPRASEKATALTEQIVAAINSVTEYRGAIYPGFLLDSRGLCLLEVNARFGDPETQVLLPRLQTDFLDLGLAVATQRLRSVDVHWDDAVTVGVVMCARGYPGAAQLGAKISGVETVDDGVEVFFGGVREERGALYVSAGRVLTVVAKGRTLHEARGRAYDNVARISFEGAYYRTDIGLTRDIPQGLAR
jgi:phosphoribosylamine--glycine ligase